MANYEFEKINDGNNEKVLVLFSGGYDSMLTTCLLIEKNYHPILVNYHTGFHVCYDDISRVYNAFKICYKDKIDYIGSINISEDYFDNYSIWKDLNGNEVNNKYGVIPPSQLTCLSCRSSMYFNAIKYCLVNNIHYIAEGAKQSQLFSIEQVPMVLEYKNFCSKYGIELLLPVFYAPDDKEEMFTEIFQRFGNKYPEPSLEKCMLGVPFNINDLDMVKIYSESAKKMFIEDIKPKYNNKLKELVR